MIPEFAALLPGLSLTLALLFAAGMVATGRI
jgi:hypothetical protein